MRIWIFTGAARSGGRFYDLALGSNKLIASGRSPHNSMVDYLSEKIIGSSSHGPLGHTRPLSTALSAASCFPFWVAVTD